MVVSDWRDRTRGRLRIGCPPIVDRLLVPFIRSGTVASLLLSRDRARSLWAARRAGRTVLWHDRAVPRRATFWSPVVACGSPWGKGGVSNALPESRGLPGTGKRAKGVHIN
jgi:hypothetical protein